MEQKPLSEEYRNEESLKEIIAQLTAWTRIEEMRQLQEEYERLEERDE